MDIEAEYNRMMQQITDKIKAMKDDEEISAEAAKEIVDMVEDIFYDAERPCPEHGPGLDCGWSSSMGYHCS
jgi:hypothetical protein